MLGFYKTAGILAALLLLGGCASDGVSSSASAVVGAVNPLKSYESVEAMAQAVDFDFLIPTALPEGYELVSCYTVSGKVVSIEFTKDEQKVLYRTAEQSGEYDGDVSISGNYTDFAQRETMQVGAYEVTFSYDTKDAPCLALWSDEMMLYSLDGLSVSEAESCILSLKAADS